MAKEISKYYLSKCKNADPERFLGKEDELKEYNGAKIYFDVANLDDKSMSPTQLSESIKHQPVKIQFIDSSSNDMAKVKKMDKIPTLVEQPA